MGWGSAKKHDITDEQLPRRWSWTEDSFSWPNQISVGESYFKMLSLVKEESSTQGYTVYIYRLSRIWLQVIWIKIFVQIQTESHSSAGCTVYSVHQGPRPDIIGKIRVTPPAHLSHGGWAALALGLHTNFCTFSFSLLQPYKNRLNWDFVPLLVTPTHPRPYETPLTDFFKTDFFFLENTTIIYVCKKKDG